MTWTKAFETRSQSKSILPWVDFLGDCVRAMGTMHSDANVVKSPMTTCQFVFASTSFG